MARSHRTDIVDGYTVLKAASRKGPKVRPASAPEPPDTPPSGNDKPAIATHIGRTALPPKHVLTCFDCGYSFKMTGRAEKTFCPKCRTEINLGDVDIRGKWNGQARTGGAAHLHADAVMEDGEVVAAVVVCEGKITGGHIRATRRLDILPGAELPEGLWEAPEVSIAPGVRMEWMASKPLRKLYLFGHLKATLQVEEKTVIHPGALLEGSLRTGAVELLDGGGLCADVSVGGA